MADMSLWFEKLERAMPWEGSGYSGGSSGNEWAWWNGKADLSKMMMYLKNEMKSENMSDTDREMTRRQKSTEQASNASANVHRMCVSPGLDLSDLHSIPVSGQAHSTQDFPSQVCSDDLSEALC